MPASLNRRVRRILIIDDNDAIHIDYRKTLCGDAAGAGGASASANKLAQAKAALFGTGDGANGAAAATAVAPRFELQSAMQGEEGLRMLKAAVQDGRPF